MGSVSEITQGAYKWKSCSEGIGRCVCIDMDCIQWVCTRGGCDKGVCALCGVHVQGKQVISGV